MTPEEINDDIAHKNQLIHTHKRNLHQLKLQAATLGLHTPPHIKITIEDTEKEIATLQEHIALLQKQRATPPQTQSPIDKRELRKRILAHFDSERIEILCEDITDQLTQAGHNIAVSPAIVGGNGLETIILNLINYLERRGVLPYLIEAIRAEQPGII